MRRRLGWSREAGEALLGLIFCGIRFPSEHGRAMKATDGMPTMSCWRCAEPEDRGIGPGGSTAKN